MGFSYIIVYGVELHYIVWGCVTLHRLYSDLSKLSISYITVYDVLQWAIFMLIWGWVSVISQCLVYHNRLYSGWSGDDHQLHHTIYDVLLNMPHPGLSGGGLTVNKGHTQCACYCLLLRYVAFAIIKLMINGSTLCALMGIIREWLTFPDDIYLWKRYVIVD